MIRAAIISVVLLVTAGARADMAIVTPMIAYRVHPEDVKGTVAAGAWLAMATAVVPEKTSAPEQVALMRQWVADDLIRNVRSGWTQVHVEGGDSENVAAFVSPDSKRFAVVIVNTSMYSITGAPMFEGYTPRQAQVRRINASGVAEMFGWNRAGANELVGIAPFGLATFTGTLQHGESEPPNPGYTAIIP